MEAKVRLTAFALKALLVTAFLAIGFTGSSKCDAQSIVGKWQRGGTRIFVLDKATGTQKPLSAQQQQQFDDMALANGYSETLEFKANNTYVSKVSAKGMAPQEKTNKYTLSGKTLDMSLPLVQGEKPTITIRSLDATTMIWDLVVRGKLTEIVYTRRP